MENCFPYNSLILLADGSYSKIGEIVEKKLDFEVISFNPILKIKESNRIIGWSINSTHKKLCRITLEKTILECSFNQKLYISGFYNKTQDGTISYTYFPEENRKINASDIEINYYCFTKDNNFSLIKDIEIFRYKQPYTYNLLISNNHNFFANDILVYDSIHL